MEVKKNNMKKNKKFIEKGFSGNAVIVSTILGGIVGVVVASLAPKTRSFLHEKLVTTVDFLQSNTMGKKLAALARKSNEMMVKSVDYSVRMAKDSKKLIADAYKAGKDAFERADSGSQEKEPFEGD